MARHHRARQEGADRAAGRAGRRGARRLHGLAEVRRQGARRTAVGRGPALGRDALLDPGLSSSYRPRCSAIGMAVVDRVRPRGTAGRPDAGVRGRERRAGAHGAPRGLRLPEVTLRMPRLSFAVPEVGRRHRTPTASRTNPTLPWFTPDTDPGRPRPVSSPHRTRTVRRPPPGRETREHATESPAGAGTCSRRASAAGVALMLGGAGVLLGVAAAPAQAAEVSYATECVPPPISGLPTGPGHDQGGDHRARRGEGRRRGARWSGSSSRPRRRTPTSSTWRRTPSSRPAPSRRPARRPAAIAMEGPRENPPIPKDSDDGAVRHEGQAEADDGRARSR